MVGIKGTTIINKLSPNKLIHTSYAKDADDFDYVTYCSKSI